MSQLVSQDEFTTLQKEVSDMSSALKGIEALLKAQQPATPASNTNVVHPVQPQPSLQPSAGSLFIGPLTSNPAAGTSPSVFYLFPKVEAATITSIMQHELQGANLYKLDPRYRDKAK